MLLAGAAAGLRVCALALRCWLVQRLVEPLPCIRLGCSTMLTRVSSTKTVAAHGVNTLTRATSRSHGVQHGHVAAMQMAALDDGGWGQSHAAHEALRAHLAQHQAGLEAKRLPEEGIPPPVAQMGGAGATAAETDALVQPKGAQNTAPAYDMQRGSGRSRHGHGGNCCCCHCSRRDKSRTKNVQADAPCCGWACAETCECTFYACICTDFCGIRWLVDSCCGCCCDAGSSCQSSVEAAGDAAGKAAGTATEVLGSAFRWDVFSLYTSWISPFLASYP